MLLSNCDTGLKSAIGFNKFIESNDESIVKFFIF